MAARAVLMKTAPGFMSPISSRPARPFVAGRDRTWTDTKSARAMRSGRGSGVTPCRRARSAVSRGLQAQTSIPKAWATSATRDPMAPSPTIPRVLPLSSLPTCWDQPPSRISRSIASSLRQRAIISPKVSSTTAGTEVPGVLVTTTRRVVAVLRSMLATPVPVIEMSRRLGSLRSRSAVNGVRSRMGITTSAGRRRSISSLSSRGGSV